MLKMTKPLVDSLKHGPVMNLPFQPDGINCLLYADDIAIVANTPRALQRLLNLAEADSLLCGYRFSPKKPGPYRNHLYGTVTT